MILFWAKQAQISSSVEFTLMMPIRIARKETKNMKYFVKLVKEYQIEHSNEFDSLEIKCFDETSTKKSVKRPAVAIVIEENEGD